MNNAQIAENIRVICKEKGISISPLLAELGIRKSLIYDLEKRDFTPSISIMEALADKLGTSIDSLIGRTERSGIVIGDISGNNSGNAGNTNCTFGATPSNVPAEALEIAEMLGGLSFKDRAQLMTMIVDFVESRKK